jgi:hypothetical protein
MIVYNTISLNSKEFGFETIIRSYSLLGDALCAQSKYGPLYIIAIDTDKICKDGTAKEIFKLVVPYPKSYSREEKYSKVHLYNIDENYNDLIKNILNKYGFNDFEKFQKYPYLYEYNNVKSKNIGPIELNTPILFNTLVFDKLGGDYHLKTYLSFGKALVSYHFGISCIDITRKKDDGSAEVTFTTILNDSKRGTNMRYDNCFKCLYVNDKELFMRIMVFYGFADSETNFEDMMISHPFRYDEVEDLPNFDDNKFEEMIKYHNN